MNEQAILDRIKYLERQKKGFQANVIAVDGAIQDCEFWLNIITEPKEENSEVKNDI
jgi:hypothetical protein